MSLPSLAASLQDFRVLQERLNNNTTKLKRLGMTVGYSELLEHLLCARANLTEFIRVGRLAAKGRTLPSVATPFSLPRRQVVASQQFCHAAEAPSSSQTFTCLRMATFEWWEIFEPTRQSLGALCCALSQSRIDVCCVTGCPVGRYSSFLDGSLGYRWFGPQRFDVQSAGFLVAVAVSDFVGSCGIAPPATDRRHAISISGFPVMGVYAPHLGNMVAEDHRAFLSATLDSFALLCGCHGGTGWMTGDFNLRGLAGGDGAKAAEGSMHARISTWMSKKIHESGLRVLASPRTHVAGGALDIHVTNVPGVSCGSVCTTLPKLDQCPSDRSIVVAETGVKIRFTGTTTLTDSGRQAVHAFKWSRDESRWACCLEPSEALRRSLADSLHTVAYAACHHCDQALPESARAVLSDSSLSLVDSLLVISGHAAGLLLPSVNPRRPGRDKSLGRMSRKDLQEAADDAATAASSYPASVACVEAAAVTASWLAVSQAARSKPPPSLLGAGWAQACSEGPAAIEGWLSRASKSHTPRLPTSSDAECLALLDFRSLVGHLDRRCLAESEIAATADAARMLGDAVRALQDDTPVAIAASSPSDDARLFFCTSSQR